MAINYYQKELTVFQEVEVLNQSIAIPRPYRDRSQTLVYKKELLLKRICEKQFNVYGERFIKTWITGIAKIVFTILKIQHTYTHMFTALPIPNLYPYQRRSQKKILECLIEFLRHNFKNNQKSTFRIKIRLNSHIKYKMSEKIPLLNLLYIGRTEKMHKRSCFQRQIINLKVKNGFLEKILTRKYANFSI